MRQQIASISVSQAAKIFAFIYAALCVALSTVFLIIDFALGGHIIREVVLFFIVYSLLAYGVTVLACIAYNVAAQRLGGLALSLEPIGEGEVETK